jgi:carbon monoxide dehydrogenase subunit G
MGNGTQTEAYVMDFKGQYSIPASPDAVWAALHDPEILAKAIPGCESLEKLSDAEMRAKAAIKIGPVKARFEGKVTIEELAPPPGFAHAMKLKGEGQGGAAGFARGESEVRLSPDAAGTLLQYDAKATVGGRLAQVGQRLIDASAKTLADEFFAKFASAMQGEEPPPPAVGPVGPSTPAAAVAPPREPPREEGLAPQIWVAGLIGVIIILLIVFSIVL